MITGMPISSGSRFIQAISAGASMIGIRKSATTRSTRSFFSSASASRPLPATSVRYPSSRRIALSTSASAHSSSTMRIVRNLKSSTHRKEKPSSLDFMDEAECALAREIGISKAENDSWEKKRA